MIASTSSGVCRCGWCVANAQYLQWLRHVRDSDSVTLRENVTRRDMDGTLADERVAAVAQPAAGARHNPLMTFSRALGITVACMAALAVSGCGGSSRIGEDLPRKDARLMLDAPAGAVHAGIALTAERGFDRGEGVRLRLRRPGRQGAVAALRRGQIEAAVVRIDELIAIRRRGVDAVGVMALVQRPVVSVVAAPVARSGSDLAGRSVAVRDDRAALGVLRTVVDGDGADFAAVDVARTLDPVETLQSGRASAAVVHRFDEAVALRRRRPELQELRPEAHGVPPYPGLVIVVRRRTLDEDASVVRALIRALQRGYREAQIDPESAATALAAIGVQTERATLLAQLDAVSPNWTVGVDDYGSLRPEVLHDWARWTIRAGVLDERPRVGRAFDTGLVGRAGAP